MRRWREASIDAYGQLQTCPVYSTAAAVVKHLPRPFSPDDRGYSQFNRFRGSFSQNLE
jgi:hypothetical protein